MTGTESGPGSAAAAAGRVRFRHPRLFSFLCFLAGLAVSSLCAIPAAWALWLVVVLMAGIAIPLAVRGPKGSSGWFFAGAILAPLLIGLWVFWLFPHLDEWWHREPFDGMRWRVAGSAPESDWPVRLRMADDLVASRRLDGLTAAQVRELLGPGNDEPGYRRGFGCHEVWWLGPERGWLRIDSEWLCVDYGADSVVSGYRLARD